MKQATFEAQFMKNLSNNEIELEKSVAYKKKLVLHTTSRLNNCYL